MPERGTKAHRYPISTFKHDKQSDRLYVSPAYKVMCFAWCILTHAIANALVASAEAEALPQGIANRSDIHSSKEIMIHDLGI